MIQGSGTASLVKYLFSDSGTGAKYYPWPLSCSSHSPLCQSRIGPGGIQTLLLYPLALGGPEADQSNPLILQMERLRLGPLYCLQDMCTLLTWHSGPTPISIACFIHNPSLLLFLLTNLPAFTHTIPLPQIPSMPFPHLLCMIDFFAPFLKDQFADHLLQKVFQNFPHARGSRLEERTLGMEQNSTQV